MASENSMILAIKRKLSVISGVRVKKIWSSAANRDIDLLIIVCGLACFYEIKVPGQQPTAWQYNRLAFWADSGAETGWYDNVDKLVDRVKVLAGTPGISADQINEYYALAAVWRQKSINL